MASDKMTPVLIEAGDLVERLDDPELLVVNVSKLESHLEGHIPGAIHLPYADLLDGRKPAVGRIPGKERLASILSTLGINSNTWVVSYDDEGSGRGARLLWTLHVVGHWRCSVLNGGAHAWRAGGHPVSHESVHREPVRVKEVSIEEAHIAYCDTVLESMEAENVQILDARSGPEYRGEKRFALRGGHIPGAVNLNWLDTIDQENAMRLKSTDALEKQLDDLGISADNEVICYCQTHHRSAHSYMMLRHLGYSRVKGYAGSWSEWGNDSALPVEI